MKYKAIFCDFDGTLYTSDHTISQVNKEAIKKFVAAGGKFVISTGRLFSAIYPKLEELGLDGDVIVYQGAGIFDIKTKKQIFGQFFDKQEAVAALEYIEALGKDKYEPLVYINDICHSQDKNAYVDEFVKICNIDYKTTEVLLSQFVKDCADKPVKVLALMTSDLCEEFVDKGCKLFPKLAFMRSHQCVVEIITKGINKGLAIKWLCDKYGITTDEAIAIGDSENDIAMIQTAGLGVAMQNAMPKVKEAADFITVSNDEDGVAKVIYEFCLNGEK
ncbi:MAG: Cof-type HAD-IIB family hydrolase [Clostridia bacterium]|nr:Cof-type HAD-IIB family hydrolase [Clostridia bacterium]MDE7329350.1 Cof-type HAD-IIB family hydrolase [Clostridia bacterium]